MTQVKKPQRKPFPQISKETIKQLKKLQASQTQIGAPIDLSRPKLKTGGGFKTERTTTFNFGGKEILIPTIVQGRQLDPNDAFRLFLMGKNPAVGIFNSIDEANTAAQLRSQEIGRIRSKE